jgi:hypothetical protein
VKVFSSCSGPHCFYGCSAVDVQLLTQYIVRQTTVLLAQLSTAAGIRAPLAHIADQVFFDLAREIEAQGVRRNVVADMFGLALRSYQLKMQRLMDTASVQRSLWRDVQTRLEAGSVSRRELAAQFPNVEPRGIAAVLNDLVDSGLAYQSGRGAQAVYGLTSELDRKRLHEADHVESLSNIVWLSLAMQGAQTEQALREQFAANPTALRAAIERLCADGRVLRQGAELHAQSFEIPVGCEEGWEAAVCDHFRAVATAIAAKLNQGASQASDRVGGTTLSFTVHETHPKKDEVYGLLKNFREQAGELWREVADYNRAHSPPSGADKVTFYFGQNVTPQAFDVESAESAITEQP